MLEMLRVIREEEPSKPSTEAEHGGWLADPWPRTAAPSRRS